MSRLAAVMTDPAGQALLPPAGLTQRPGLFLFFPDFPFVSLDDEGVRHVSPRERIWLSRLFSADRFLADDEKVSGERSNAAETTAGNPPGLILFGRFQDENRG